MYRQYALFPKVKFSESNGVRFGFEYAAKQTPIFAPEPQGSFVQCQAVAEILAARGIKTFIAECG